MKNLSKKICVGLIFLGAVFPIFAFAQIGSSDATQNNFQLVPCDAPAVSVNDANGNPVPITTNPVTGAATTPCTYNSLITTVQRFINLLLYASGFIAIILVVYAGFNYLTAGGDTNKTTKARKILTAAVIGMIIAFCSWLVVNTVVTAVLNTSFGGGASNINPLSQQ